MLPVSVVVLTANEEENIERCLKSVSWSNDVILIDNSSDKTVEVAQKEIPPKYLRVIQDRTDADFAYLRNKGLEIARNPLVFFVDADEEVSLKLHEEIAQTVKSSKSPGFYVRRKDFFLGKWLRYGETGTIRLLKLARKDAGLWRRSVHEVWDIKGPAPILKEALLHFPHPTIAEFVDRIDRWTTIDAQVFKTLGKRSSWWKILVYPSAKFLQNYVLRLGILDGMPGLLFALLMSFHSFLTRSKLYFLQRP